MIDQWFILVTFKRSSPVKQLCRLMRKLRAAGDSLMSSPPNHGDQMALPDTIDVNQAAAMLFTSRGIVLALAKSGRLPGTKIGRSRVFLRADVLSFLRSRVDADTTSRRIAADASLVAGTFGDSKAAPRTTAYSFARTAPYSDRPTAQTAAVICPRAPAGPIVQESDRRHQ